MVTCYCNDLDHLRSWLLLIPAAFQAITSHLHFTNFNSKFHLNYPECPCMVTRLWIDVTRYMTRMVTSSKPKSVRSCYSTTTRCRLTKSYILKHTLSGHNGLIYTDRYMQKSLLRGANCSLRKGQLHSSWFVYFIRMHYSFYIDIRIFGARLQLQSGVLSYKSYQTEPVVKVV